MRNLIFITLLIATVFAACKTDELKSTSVGCNPYIDLYFFNYDSLKSDPINLQEYKIDGNCLELTVSYSGCTTGHTIDLAYMHPWCGTPPLPPPTFEIRHDSKGEMCKMLVTETRKFDLTPLQNPDSTKISFIVSYPVDSINFSSISLDYHY